MQYTLLGRTGYRVSRLGYGAMRLPTKGDRIDRDKAIPMLLAAIDGGVNYIDTAAGYNGGDSERVIGEALRTRPGLREKIVLSTKNPHYDKRNDKPWWENLEGSLRRLGVEAIDLYHFHFLAWESFRKHVAGRGGQLEWMRKAYDQGLVKHICFSFHDKPENLIKLAKTGEFESVTLQYNLIDRSNEKAIDVVSKLGLGIVVMGPVGGGRLGSPSKEIQKILPAARSVPEIALRFVLSNPSVDIALSGMSEMAHVKENVQVASRATPLSADEKRRVRAALTRYKKLADLYCTGCNYCLPCPWGVQIPLNFTALNYHRVYGLEALAKQRYPKGAGSAARCVACGACLKKCPQHIDIIQQLRQTVRTLDDAYGKVVVQLEPLEVRAAAEGRGAEVLCRLEAQNLSDQEAAPRIELSGKDGIVVTRGKGPTPARYVGGAPGPFSMPSLGPFARHRAELTLRLDSLDGGATLTFRPAIAPPLQMVNATPAIALAVARPSGAKAAPVHAALTPGAGKKSATIRRKYGLAARFAHDAKGLRLQFDLRGPFTAAEEEAHRSKSWWTSNRLSVTLDLDRQPGLRRSKGASGSAELRLFLSPGRFDLSGMGLTEEDRKQAQISWTGSPSRRRITALLPWELLKVERPKPPARMGLSFRLTRVGAGGATLAWTDNNPGYLMLTK